MWQLVHLKHTISTHTHTHISGAQFLKTHFKYKLSTQTFQEFIDQEWLKYFEYKCTETKPMTFMSVCTSVDPPDLHLRLTHTHGYSHDDKLAGHYHYDMDGDCREADYEG